MVIEEDLGVDWLVKIEVCWVATDGETLLDEDIFVADETMVDDDLNETVLSICEELFVEGILEDEDTLVEKGLDDVEIFEVRDTLVGDVVLEDEEGLDCEATLVEDSVFEVDALVDEEIFEDLDTFWEVEGLVEEVFFVVEDFLEVDSDALEVTQSQSWSNSLAEYRWKGDVVLGLDSVSDIHSWL